MERLTAVEWDFVSARVKAAVAVHRLPTSSRGFLQVALEQFFPGRSGGFSEIITDGGNDLGIDAIEILEHGDRAEILVFQAKYRDALKSADKTINDSDVLKILNFFHALFEKATYLRETGNLQLTEAVTRIWQVHERGAICRYRIVLCSNDRGLSPSAKTLFENGLKGLPGVDYEEYGARDLIRDVGIAGRQRESGYLCVVGREVFERSDGDIRGVVASVDAASFVKLIQTEDGRSVKRHLFDDNLRVFLGANGGFNGEIIATATSDDSHLFWYLNNGITITCRDYAYNKGHSNPKIRIDDFQIVNGAQTSHSLLEAARRSPDALQNVVLTVRVYATSRTDIAERVAVATNSQARIQARDLRANHSVLKKMEIAFAERGYFFERKRNMHSDKDQRKRIDALKLGQILLSFMLKEPDRAKADSDNIFDDRFTAIFHEHHNMDEVCRIVELYQAIEEMRDEYLGRHGEAIEGGGERSFLVYGHWFILFAAGLLLRRQSKAVPVKAECRPLILDAIGLVARACGQTRTTSHYQMFRSPRTRDKIVAELSGKQTSLLDLLAALPE
jgi:AIPR protein